MQWFDINTHDINTVNNYRCINSISSICFMLLRRWHAQYLLFDLFVTYSVEWIINLLNIFKWNLLLLVISPHFSLIFFIVCFRYAKEMSEMSFQLLGLIKRVSQLFNRLHEGKVCNRHVHLCNFQLLGWGGIKTWWRWVLSYY